MHIHHNPMMSANAGIHSAGAAEKAAAAQRASETRRKLLNRTSQMEGELSAGGILIEGRPQEQRGDRERQPPPPKQPGEGDEEGPSGTPISVWV